MSQLKQSTAVDKLVFMTDATDHVSGKTGLTLTITASKAGGAFASITPTVTERGNGWYSLALTTSHTDTLGDFGVHITGTGADPTDVLWEVVTELTGQLANDAITAAKIAANAITNAKVADDTISAGKIAVNAITASRIAADAIGATQIAANAITSAKIAANAITATQINDGAITNAKIADNAITASKIAANAITVTQLADNAITAAKLAANAIGATQLAADAIQAAKIQDGALTANKLAADAITAAKIAADAITEIQSGLGTLANQTTINNNVIAVGNAVTAVGTDVDDVQTRLPAALVSGRMSSDLQAISGSTVTLALLVAMLQASIRSAVNDAAASTTVFITDLTETTTDHYKDAYVVFISGVLTNQGRKISAYNGTTKAITVATAFTDVPGDNDEFIIVGRSE